MVVTRFAPSPTGRLHLGHAYSALFAWDMARRFGGRFLLRIEDIDPLRSRPEFVDAIYEDLAWIGLRWTTPVRRQSLHLPDYVAALAVLAESDLLYPCFCTRKDIVAEIGRAGVAPHGPDGPVYPGICRDLNVAERGALIESGRSYALRLNIDRAIDRAGPLEFVDPTVGSVEVDPTLVGDVVLARKDVATSYHLSVTVDDAVQRITHVTRGEDLLPATHIHRLLQALLGLPQPEYLHHRLLSDDEGRRLAKREGAVTLQALRDDGQSPADVRAMIGLAD
jgi:glutamyl-Q tRNA(Asp) synthetase